MAWNDIDLEDVDVNVLGTSSLMNSLSDNLTYLHAPNAASYYHPGTGGNYTVSGSLGVDVDGTNFSLTITTYGGPVLAGFYGNIGTSATTTSLRMNIIQVDTISHIGRNLFSNYATEVSSTTTTGEPRGFMVPFFDLPAGSHTFKLVWGVSGAGTGTLYVALRPTFWVTEL